MVPLWNVPHGLKLIIWEVPQIPLGGVIGVGCWVCVLGAISCPQSHFVLLPATTWASLLLYTLLMWCVVFLAADKQESVQIMEWNLWIHDLNKSLLPLLQVFATVTKSQEYLTCLRGVDHRNQEGWPQEERWNSYLTAGGNTLVLGLEPIDVRMDLYNWFRRFLA